MRDQSIDLLVIAPQSRRLEVFERAARECLDLQVRMIEATALYEDLLGHVPIGTINSAWFQFIMHPRYSPSSPLSKRALDLLVVGADARRRADPMLLCALAIKLEDRGPVFYRQRRVGEEGREFDMLKFRMLRPDADDLWGTHDRGGAAHPHRPDHAQDAPQRAAPALAGLQGRDEPRRPAPGAARSWSTSYRASCPTTSAARS